jgi:hypothetical protein
MGQSRVEWRRSRRAELQGTLLTRRLGAPTSEPFREQTVCNLSLTGAYVEADREAPIAVNEEALFSVSIPAGQRRSFPFARLAGRSRVVRIDQLPSASGRNRRGIGVALAFSSDVTALMAMPTLG